MKVEFIDKWGDDLRVSNVARVSFGKWKEEFDERDAKLINYLASHEHTSPFRHVGVSIRCEAPIFIARQAQKHVIGLAWNEESRRYVDDPPQFYYPNSWRSRPDGSVKQGSGEEIIHPDLLSVDKTYEGSFGDIEGEYYDYDAIISLCVRWYNQAIEAGVAPEQARMILPQSMMTSWIWTGSLQAFAHLCKLRLEKTAQQEWKELAQPIYDICKEHFPHSWRALMNDNN